MLANSSICDDQVFAQLTDMFGDNVPTEIILRIGRESKWKRKYSKKKALFIYAANYRLLGLNNPFWIFFISLNIPQGDLFCKWTLVAIIWRRTLTVRDSKTVSENWFICLFLNSKIFVRQMIPTKVYLHK